MAFRIIALKPSFELKASRMHSRREKLGPEHFKKMYAYKKPHLTKKGKSYSTMFESFPISDSTRYLLKCYGHPFNYQGVRTTSYNMNSLMKMFGRNRLFFWKIEKRGILPRPFFKVKNTRGIGTNYWLYYQIQPVFIYFKHQMTKNIVRFTMKQKDMEVLRRLQHAQEQVWCVKLGVDKPKKHSYYEERAGKFGVLPIDD